MNRPLALIPFLVLILAVATGLLWHFGDVRSEKGIVSVPTGETVTIGGPFSLIDQNGMRRSEKDFSGKYMLVFFGYTFCPDVCPTTLSVMSAALDKVGPDATKIVPVFISVDPKRDTPEKLKAYLASFGPNFVGLTGTDEEVAAAAKAYRVYYQAHTEEGDNYAVDHSGVVYLMSPTGQFLSNYTLETSPESMAVDLKKRILTAR
ncbi:MAG TPA: SCO family protein [Micropepsaceae bacterium]|nr:SCO family protein [Micropepsaceae bacterium]